MTDSELLRAMGEYIREHGFSPEYNESPGDPNCGCFIHARNEIAAPQPIPQTLWEVIDSWNTASELRLAGWTKGATKDAAAACFIASDLAAP